MLRLAALLLLWSLAALPALAQDCRLALLLALDVSSSVDETEYAMQRDGLAAALRDPEVQAAILGAHGVVQLAVYEWSGRRQQSVVTGWTALSSPAAIEAVARRIEAATRSETRFPTAMGYALGYGATLMGTAPPCARQVIDVSGDGINNDGFRPKLAYKHFPFNRITVNGLAVLGADNRLLDYYRDELLHGPDAFMETANGYDGFREAMTRKLLRETLEAAVGAAPGNEGVPVPASYRLDADN